MKKMKYIRLLCLMLCLLILASCHKNEPVEETETSTETEQSKYVPSDSELLLVADNIAYCGVVRPKSMGKDQMELCSNLMETVKSRTEVKIDLIPDTQNLSDGMVEILIGDTNRIESRKAKEKLGKYEYSISVVNGKIVVVGSDILMLENAINQLIDMVDMNPEQINGGVWTIPINYDKKFDGSDFEYDAYIGRGFEWTSKYELVNGLSTHTDIVSEGLKFPWAQGGCTDGTYYYCFMMTHNASEVQGNVILKYDIATQTLVKQSKKLSLDHGNDAAYNPHNNTLIVIGGGVWHYVLDADTFEIVKYVPAKYSSGMVSYDPNKHLYMIGDNYRFCFYNDDFELVRELPYSGLFEEFDKETGKYGTQGMTSDDKYIYVLENWVHKDNNRMHRCNIVVYDINTGKLLDRIPLSMGREVEHIFIRDGSFYITCNNLDWNRAVCYKVDIEAKV